MSKVDYGEVIDRISSIYSSCLPAEKKIFTTILKEVSKKGYSETLEQIWLKDFTEVPVSIDRFISDSKYLGETNDNGAMVYPFWKETLKNIFTEENRYYEILFSGATRIGKTSTAITCMAYMLYRLMIYRDPHKFFHKKSVSKFTVGFANLTKELATGVGFREFQDTIKMSEWFNSKGKFTRSEQNFYYIPDGGKIEIIPASDAAHLLGKQLWCLTGDTKIVTSNGVFKLKDLSGAVASVKQVDVSTGNTKFCKAPVVMTGYRNDLVRVTLSDSFVLEGTPEHQMLMRDGAYKQLDDIAVGDVLYGAYDCKSLFEHRIVDVRKVHLKNPVPVYDVINAGIDHNFLVYDDASGCCVVSHNCCLLDEVNFTKASIKDINKAKVSMKKLYDTANARITGTFKLGGQVYGKMFTCSSKNSDSDYLSDHIETQLNAGNTTMYLVDEPQWKVHPKEMFSNDTFYIAVGDRYKKGFVIDDKNSDEEHLNSYRSEGYQLLEVPRDFVSNFKSDFDIALRDIAGISVVGSMGFITQESVTVNVSEERSNPFYFDIIVCGYADSETLERNFHSDLVPSKYKSLPMHVHIDFAEVSDHTGICGVVQDGSKIVVDPATGRKSSMPFYRQVFQIAVEAPRGDRMSFQKVINFIVWLRRTGFNVVKVTTDQYQSSYVRETLIQKGFNVGKVSVDSSEDAYIALRNVLQDQRIELVKHQLQEDELVHLQRVNGRIDHPPQSTGGSEDNYSRSGPPGIGAGKGIGKDCADALAGSLWSAIQDSTVAAPSGKSLASAMSLLNGLSGPSSRIPSVLNSNGIHRF